MLKSIILLLLICGIETTQTASAQDSCLVAGYLAKYDTTLKAVHGKYRVKIHVEKSELASLQRQKKPPIQYANEILEIAKMEFSEMEAVLNFACKKFECNDSVLAIKRMLHKSGVELTLEKVFLLDSVSAVDGIFIAGYYLSFAADFMVQSDTSLKFRIYYDTGDLGGVSSALYGADQQLILKYYVDDYNNYDQNLFIGNDLFFELQIHQEEIDVDELSHMWVYKKYLKCR